MEKDRIPALFGSSVFNEDAMRRYLPSEAVDAWRDCLENGRHLGLPLANAIADGITDQWELAEHFGVSVPFLQKALCLYTYGNLATELYF